jgi:hypothetical protein
MSGYIILLILRIFKALINLLAVIILLCSVKSLSPVIRSLYLLTSPSVHFFYLRSRLRSGDVWYVRHFTVCFFANKCGITCITWHHFACYKFSAPIFFVALTFQHFVWYVSVTEVCILQQRQVVLSVLLYHLFRPENVILDWCVHWFQTLRDVQGIHKTSLLLLLLLLLTTFPVLLFTVCSSDI